MENFENKTAYVTGAASGIGYAISEALVKAGANVMMADIDGERLSESSDTLRNHKGRVETHICDVIKAENVQAGFEATKAAFGNIHLLFNNAGVGLAGKPGQIAIEDWRWIVDINLMGIVHGVESFVPHMRAHGEGGHIVNTASMAGHFTMPGMAPYHATKFAAVGYSEALAQELASQNIGVSVLCPTWVKSNIYNTGKQAPTHRAKLEKAQSLETTATGAPTSDTTANQMYQLTKGLVENGMDASTLAELVLKSIQANRLYIFNDREARASVDRRRDMILKDYDACLKDLGL